MKKDQQVNKITNNSPELDKRKNISLSPDLVTTPETRGSVRRKLDLQKGTSGGECTLDNDSSTEIFLLLNTFLQY